MTTIPWKKRRGTTDRGKLCQAEDPAGRALAALGCSKNGAILGSGWGHFYRFRVNLGGFDLRRALAAAVL